jgi:hypothetical protein
VTGQFRDQPPQLIGGYTVGAVARVGWGGVCLPFEGHCTFYGQWQRGVAGPEAVFQRLQQLLLSCTIEQSLLT